MGDKRRVNPIVIKIGLFIGIVILIFVALAIYKETSKKRQVQEQIKKLKSEAEQINRDNSSIQEKIAYFQSKEYMEKEAKDKLNLQSPDEQVVVVKPNMLKEQLAEAVSTVQPQVPAPYMANRIKWWNYFFKY